VHGAKWLGIAALCCVCTIGGEAKIGLSDGDAAFAIFKMFTDN